MKKYQTECSINTFSRCQSNSGLANFPSFWSCWDTQKTHHFGNQKEKKTPGINWNRSTDLKLNPCQCMNLIWCGHQVKHMARPHAVAGRGSEVPTICRTTCLPTFPLLLHHVSRLTISWVTPALVGCRRLARHCCISHTVPYSKRDMDRHPKNIAQAPW